MATAKIEVVDSAEAKMNHPSRDNGASAPVRVRHETKAKLEQLLRRANKERLGRRVKPDDLIGFGLSLITDAHLATICDGTLSNKDRMELLYRRMSKERRGLTKEEFFGLLLGGNLPK